MTAEELHSTNTLNGAEGGAETVKRLRVQMSEAKTQVLLSSEVFTFKSAQERGATAPRSTATGAPLSKTICHRANCVCVCVCTQLESR
jgi:hypothetical protein